MKTLRILIPLALLTGLLAVSAGAQAATVSDIKAEVSALQDATSNARFLGPRAAQNQAGLLAKLSDAQAKLDQNKLGDALTKLQQFRDKVATLDAQGKIDHDDAVVLLGLADQVILDLRDLLTQ